MAAQLEKTMSDNHENEVGMEDGPVVCHPDMIPLYGGTANFSGGRQLTVLRTRRGLVIQALYPEADRLVTIGIADLSVAGWLAGVFAEMAERESVPVQSGVVVDVPAGRFIPLPLEEDDRPTGKYPEESESEDQETEQERTENNEESKCDNECNECDGCDGGEDAPSGGQSHLGINVVVGDFAGRASRPVGDAPSGECAACDCDGGRHGAAEPPEAEIRGELIRGELGGIGPVS
jgi:hypothetical protein